MNTVRMLLIAGFVNVLVACQSAVAPTALPTATATAAPTAKPTATPALPTVTPRPIEPTATTVVVDTPTLTATEEPYSGPLYFDWSLEDWRIDDKDPTQYIGTLLIIVHGGQPPYKIYYNTQLQAGEKFEFTAPKCGDWNIRLAIQSADGDYFDSEASITSPYCSK